MVSPYGVPIFVGCVMGHARGIRFRSLRAGRIVTDLVRKAVVSPYFALTYRVLTSRAGPAFLGLAAAPGAPAVHGYTTADDVRALTEDLRPSAGDTLVDPGCGVGEVAIAVHHLTGCRVAGVDSSPRAVAEARRRADAARVSAAVRFEVGQLGFTSAPASAAYALDSVMFAGPLWEVLHAVSSLLDPPASNGQE